MLDSTTARAARLLCIGFPGTRPTRELEELVELGVRSVILFARNAGERDQVAETISSIKALARDPADPILVCVDQEGGETIRFREGFHPPPFMRAVRVAVRAGCTDL